MSDRLDLLEENLRAELARQRMLVSAIEEKIEAMRAFDVTRMEKALESLAAAGIEGARLENDRRALFERMRPEFGGKLPETIRQAVSRFADQKPELNALHRELKDAAAKAEELCRKSSHLVRHFRDVYDTALDRVFEAAGIHDPESPDGRVSSGLVINAEG